MAPIVSLVRTLTFGLWFLLFWLGALFLSWVILPIAVFRARHLTKVERVQRCQDIVGVACSLFHFGMRVTGALVCEPKKIRFAAPSRPFLMVSNHPTLVDVTALLAAVPRLCCVVKTELFESIAIGPVLRFCGHIEGGSSVMDGASAVQVALDRIAENQSVLIFPEGTRSPRYQIGSFRRGAFEVAMRGNIPICPVFVTCDKPTLMKGMVWYKLPPETANLRAETLDPILPDSFGTCSRALSKRIESIYADKLALWQMTHPTLTAPHVVAEPRALGTTQ